MAVLGWGSVPGVGIWVVVGGGVRSVLQNPGWLVLFKVLMALLLGIWLYPLLLVESAFH